jgi:hypothetical protein
MEDSGVGASKVMEEMLTRSSAEPGKSSSGFFYSKRSQVIEKARLEKINANKR